ncbi:MAG: hypothetical protein IT384_01160 [Deltaproteobacteria bacterium]|nr:hypothetical protein [Deltaproteobacteria bacterium]
MSGVLQDAVVWAIIAGAALYLVRHLTGGSRLPFAARKRLPTVKLGARLERGLRNRRG